MFAYTKTKYGRVRENWKRQPSLFPLQKQIRPAVTQPRPQERQEGRVKTWSEMDRERENVSVKVEIFLSPLNY